VFQIDQADEYLPDTDSTNVLCTVLEAMFLHGLKDSFLRRVTIAVRSDFDERPEPNFWAPLLVVSHRNVIDQVRNIYFEIKLKKIYLWKKWSSYTN